MVLVKQIPLRANPRDRVTPGRGTGLGYRTHLKHVARARNQPRNDRRRPGQADVLACPRWGSSVRHGRRPLQLISERIGIIFKRDLELARVRSRLDLPNGFRQRCSFRRSSSNSLESTGEERFHVFVTRSFGPVSELLQHLDNDRTLMLSCSNRFSTPIESRRRERRVAVASRFERRLIDRRIKTDPRRVCIQSV